MTSRSAARPPRHRLRRRLILAVLAPAIPSAAPATADPTATLAMMPIRILDTSGEPRDQSAEHARRLDAMARSLAEHLRRQDRYRVVAVEAPALDAACPGAGAECILSAARSTGAGFAFLGVVHKSSTLIMQMFARVVETGGGRTVFNRELNFRGDNDEAWRRAEDFLAAQFDAEPPVHQAPAPQK